FNAHQLPQSIILDSNTLTTLLAESAERAADDALCLRDALNLNIPDADLEERGFLGSTTYLILNRMPRNPNLVVGADATVIATMLPNSSSQHVAHVVVLEPGTVVQIPRGKDSRSLLTSHFGVPSTAITRWEMNSIAVTSLSHRLGYRQRDVRFQYPEEV